ncbi:MAG TPA: preprotein translocase subunit SecA, partial [Isosphaeraceae bacterium]|nr:preprotein translocase subunit SecA [Isosphaeraceae bacterium]
MANRLGPTWLNRVTRLTGPTPTGRFSKFALLVPRINALELVLEPLSNEELRAKSEALRLKAKQGDSLSSLLVEAFALVRESAKRAIGQRHFDVQLLGGIAIHNRCIAELETGEGKTLVATLPVFLNALPGK